MIFINLEDRELAHLAGLLGTYQRWAREQGMRPLPALVDLAAAVIEATRSDPKRPQATISPLPPDPVDDAGDDELLTTQGAAAVLQVTPRTVQRMVRAGRLQPALYAGRLPRFRRGDVVGPERKAAS